MNSLASKSLLFIVLSIFSIASFANVNKANGQAIVGNWKMTETMDIPEGQLNGVVTFKADKQVSINFTFNGFSVYKAYGSWRIEGNILYMNYYAEHALVPDMYGAVELHVEQSQIINSITANKIVLKDIQDGELDTLIKI